MWLRGNKEHETNCHPEPLFWAKDLPRCVGLNCGLVAFSPESRPESRDKARKAEISREVLRPTSGLRMTVTKGIGLEAVFGHE